ncbi:tRNA nucleotidyltransferase (CCA-adding enzyme) [Scopulibacillus daqui]|uniref:CCA-adding enzyme n=1 Tax=Scopulibacillus daqui TaxID=1469162 RepID=A0ABS2PZ72_9BACL|nr:CCA tRNA nucleotidyltransferase [Scopulibacillus daqui]MBM7645266.1 tRNA nucleotidyltransferase (CCA-adding enzyme) [Scopulibacillus daqui]
MLNKAPFKTAYKVLNKLHQHGFDAYIVGGAVRDYILNRPVHDIDITTSARPDQVQALFSKTIPVGIEHGTVIVREEGANFEVTTFRSESGYADYRHPEQVYFETSITEDLKRRDFTMNAIALSIDGGIIDPYNGQHDLKENRLMTVGDPEVRFKEDPLRMLRGLRFMSQLGLDMPLALENTCRELAPLLKNISVERIYQEFTKLLKGKNLQKAFHILLNNDIHQYLPCLKDKQSECRQFSALSLEKLLSDEERWCALMIQLDINDIAGFCRAWKMSKKQKNWLLKHTAIYRQQKQHEWTRESLYRSGLSSALSVERLKKAFRDQTGQTEADIINLWDKMPIHDRKHLHINGKDLSRWLQRKPGPWIEQLLSKIEGEVLCGRLQNDYEEIKRWVMSFV